MNDEIVLKIKITIASKDMFGDQSNCVHVIGSFPLDKQITAIGVLITPITAPPSYGPCLEAELTLSRLYGICDLQKLKFIVQQEMQKYE